MSPKDMALLKTMIQEASVEAAHREEALHDKAACKIRWRRRLIFMTCFIGGAYVIGEMMHIEPLLKGWEILAAPLIDKAIFGVGAA